MIIDYILERLQEASTIRGLIMLFGRSLGANSPQIAAIVPFIMALVGLVGTLLPNKLSREDSNSDGDRKVNAKSNDPKQTTTAEKTNQQNGFNDK